MESLNLILHRSNSGKHIIFSANGSISGHDTQKKKQWFTYSKIIEFQLSQLPLGVGPLQGSRHSFSSNTRLLVSGGCSAILRSRIQTRYSGRWATLMGMYFSPLFQGVKLLDFTTNTEVWCGQQWKSSLMF